MQRKQDGFTLVELAIVLVVIGMLVGGVLVGQSMIRAAGLNSILSEQEKYTTAVHAFHDKYFSWPGDLPNAYAYWGDACGTDTTDASDGCNGNGDGVVNYELDGEPVKLWEHLSRAGLMESAFDGTGTVYSGSAVAITADNVPKSKFPGGYWNMSNSACEGCGAGVPDYSGMPLVHLMLSIGALYPSSPDLNYVSPFNFSLTNGEAYSLDKKIDDGHATNGMMRSINANGLCGDGDSGDLTDYYDLRFSAGGISADSISQCVPTFIID